MLLTLQKRDTELKTQNRQKTHKTQKYQKPFPQNNMQKMQTYMVSIVNNDDHARIMRKIKFDSPINLNLLLSVF